MPPSKGEVSDVCDTRSRLYGINQDYFKTWSPNMAYVLGFWYADGCIYSQRCFDITAPKKDKYIVKKIAEELGFCGKLCDEVDKQVSRINFSCQTVYDDIASLGGVDCKFPEVPKQYMPDFIRGYFDGNGRVSCIKGNRINVAIAGVGKIFNDKMLEVLKTEVGIESGSCDEEHQSICLGNRDSFLLGRYMYKSNSELFLIRKRQKFPN